MTLIKLSRTYYLFISFIILLLDQFSKYIIKLDYINLLNKNYVLFRIDFVKNYGAAFNLFSEYRTLLSLISFIFSIILIYIITNKHNVNYIDLYGYSFILGGTLGNGLDRIFKGYVIDFINLNFINFPIFNIADISINIGFILIFYSLIFFKK